MTSLYLVLKVSRVLQHGTLVGGRPNVVLCVYLSGNDKKWVSLVAFHHKPLELRGKPIPPPSPPPTHTHNHHQVFVNGKRSVLTANTQIEAKLGDKGYA